MAVHLHFLKNVQVISCLMVNIKTKPAQLTPLGDAVHANFANAHWQHVYKSVW